MRGENVGKRKVNKAYKQRLITFGGISVVIIFYFIVNSIQYIVDINRLFSEQKRLANELIALKEEEENLKKEIQKLQDPDYIARYARENYLYSKDGEYVIRIDPKEEQELEKPEQKNYKKILGWSLGGMAVLFWLIKRKK